VGYPKVLVSFLGIETQKRSLFLFFFHSSVLIVGFKAGSNCLASIIRAIVAIVFTILIIRRRTTRIRASVEDVFDGHPLPLS
jgi:hypothetical protein